jgi:hypothetical protein
MLTLSQLLVRKSNFLLTVALCIIAASVGITYFGLGWVNPLQTIDGTYQTFGMLDRLNRHELPGINYIPYLGVGLNYAMAPMFFAFGKNVFSSFASAQLLTCASWLLISIISCWIARWPKREAVALGATIFIAGSLIDLQFGSLIPGYRPGVSLLLLREIAVIVPLFVIITVKNISIRPWALSPIAGAMIFWSPSSGISQFIACSVLSFVMIMQGRPYAILKFAFWLMLSISTSIFTAIVLSDGNPKDFLYKIFIVSGESQFWFFPGFQSNQRVLTVFEIPRIFMPSLASGFYFLVSTFGFVIVVWQQGLASRRGQAGALLAIAWGTSGFASCYAGHVSEHYFATYRAGGALLLLSTLLRYVASSPLPKQTKSVAIAFSLLALSGTAIVAMSTEKGHRFTTAMLSLRSANERRIDALGLPLPHSASKEVAFLRELRRSLDAQAIPPKRRIFSTYYAWPDIMIGADPQPRYNSIIHALGPDDRASFIRSFRYAKAPWAATISPYWSGYEAWSMRASWYFYRELIEKYSPIYRGTSMLYWRRRSKAVDFLTPSVTCHVFRRSKNHITLKFGVSSIRRILIDVSVQYDARTGRGQINGDLGRGYVRVADRSTGLLEKIRFAREHNLPYQPDLDASPGIFYGLPAGRNSLEIPVDHHRGVSELNFEMQGGADSSIEIQRCKVIRIFASPSILQFRKISAN